METVLTKLKVTEIRNIIRVYNKEAKIDLRQRKPELIASLIKHLSGPVEIDIQVAKKPIERPKRLKRQISSQTETALQKLAEADTRLLQQKPKPIPKPVQRSATAQKPRLDDETIKRRLAELESLGPMF